MKSIYILGNGAMASAMAFGLKDQFKVIIVGRRQESLEALSKAEFKTMLYEDFDINNKDVILGFKPYALEEVASKIKGKANFIISPLACTPFNKLEIIKAKNYCLIMPNLGAKYKASCTPYFLQNEHDKGEIKAVIEGFGDAILLENEAQMNAAGTLAGCTPAYLAMVADALCVAGVYNGLNVKMSKALVDGAFASMAALIKHTHPSLLKEGVCSPAGTTIKGVFELEKANIRSGFIKAVNASVMNKN